ncbi:MAG TPA: AMP-binding protein [Burkholderiaceae bacterium]|nr:AMP-binding protein [Burkholderiaceae bacterium]
MLQTIGELLERNARFHPEREALVCEGRRLSHRQLLERAKRLADGLHRMGLRRQDRVAILSMNNAEYIELLAAGDWAGFIVATVNFRLAAAEIEWLLGDATPRVLVFEAQYAQLVGALRPRLATIEAYVCIGGRAPDWARDYEAVIAEGSPEGPPFRSQAQDYGPLVYTSGTTGRPKGALRAQWRWVRTADAGSRMSELDSDSRMLLTTPAFHVGVIGYALQVRWCAGTLVLHRGFDAANVIRTIQQERISFTFVVSAMLQAILESPAIGDADLSSLHNVVAAAAPVPVALLRRAFERIGPVFSVQYGATETAACGLYRHELKPFGDARDMKRIASVGHPGQGTRIRVVGDDGEDCPAATAGEVWTFTDERMDGYWNNTAATLEALQGGWFRTGDVGYLDEDGYLFLVDRKKDMIISGGENIYSREVEEAVQSYPGIVECAVIGVPDPRWGEAVKAYVVCASGASAPEGEVIAHCRRLIAGYKCPKHVEAIAELPRVPSGKVNKVALRERARNSK